MLDQIAREADLAVATVLQGAARIFRPVAALFQAREVAHGGNGFGTTEEDEVEFAAADGLRKLIDEMLRTLAPHGLEDRAGRVCADPRCH